jgi:tripartite-type tricarboxylate transporter receptor subunit TctC
MTHSKSAPLIRCFVLGLVAATMCTVCAGTATAAYPERPIRLICSSGAGGIVDITARIVANRMSEILEQPVIVEDMPGGGSTIAIRTVAHAEPDGYTLLFTGAGISVAEALNPDLHVDVVNGLAAISVIGDTPLVLFVHKSVPGQSYQSIISYLKSHPDQVTSGSNGRGTGSYLALEYFRKLADVQVVNVTYKSTPEVLTDLVAGRIGLTFTAIGSGILKSPEIRPIGITALRRSKDFPDVPTFDELGVQDFQSGTPTMLLAPKDTPKTIIDALANAAGKSLADPAVTTQLDNAGIVKPAELGPDYAARFLKAEVNKWGSVLREAKD